MDKNLVKSTAKRLNIYDEVVVKKCEEFLRLYQSKAVVKSLNNQAKIVLCLDLASQCLGRHIDKETALLLSGFKKSLYQNHLNTLEKLLELDKIISISDVCVQLGCMSIKEDAEAILGKYQKSGNFKDMEHPQYVAAATYLACKVKKIPLDKQKLVSISRLKPSQWKELVGSFEKLGMEKGRTTQKLSVDEDKNECAVEVDILKPTTQDDQVEEYEVWKKRILAESYAALEKQKGRIEH
ncbi:origin recognition complex subunit 6 [Euwallacea fornicatus]|uniref:origin recognition complex subunit 6 n=1 Tax=Euwallacea fornicatus TaxID=995702 RepID=UPI00338D923C